MYVFNENPRYAKMMYYNGVLIVSWTHTFLTKCNVSLFNTQILLFLKALALVAMLHRIIILIPQTVQKNFIIKYHLCFQYLLLNWVVMWQSCIKIVIEDLQSNTRSILLCYTFS